MNERIEELMNAYLDGSASRAQEQQLLDACEHDSELTGYLKRTLRLSLHLRDLREREEVPAGVRSALLSRINQLEAERSEDERRHAVVKDRRPAHFGWQHVLGASLATAAAAVLVFLLLPRGATQEQSTVQLVQVTDTVLRTVRDTVREVRTISTPVYIVQDRPPASEDAQDAPSRDANAAGAQEHELFAGIPEVDTGEGRVDARPLPLEDAVPMAASADETDDTDPGELTVKQEALPAFISPRERSYLDQYQDMLATIETVELTSSDKISY